VNTPGFRSIARRNLPNHPHTVYLRKDVCTEGYKKEYEKHWTESNYTLVSGNSTTHAFGYDTSKPPIAHLDESRYLAAARLRKEVGGMQVNLAQAFGERQQTAKLLADTTERLAKAAVALKRGRFGDFVTALELSGHGTKSDRSLRRRWDRAMNSKPNDRLANHWLEWKYGWGPLLKDIRDSAELLAKHVTGYLYHTQAKSSAKAWAESSWESTFNGPDGYVGFPVVPFAKNTLNTFTVSKYQVRYRLDDAAQAILAQTGISNPALLAWELLPFSFVVDWLIPVGEYLEGLTVYDGFTLQGGTLSQLTKMELFKVLKTTPIYSLDQYGSRTAYKEFFGSWRCRETLFTRSLISTWPSGTPLQFRNPIGSNALDRFATAFSLLNQVFSRGSSVVFKRRPYDLSY